MEHEANKSKLPQVQRANGYAWRGRDGIWHGCRGGTLRSRRFVPRK